MDTSELTFEERDEFSRKPIAKKIISLLRSDIDISPMIIDGSWGTGKSEFCHKLINLFKKEESHHLIYIDAFKADHADEPLMTILAEVIKALPEGEGKKNIMKKALPVIRYSLKTVGKAAVSHLLRQDFADKFDEYDEEMQKAADDAIDSTAAALLKNHIEAESSLKTLKDALEKAVSEKPMIIFIDELDRCRPNFAVDILEIIKHTFDINKVSFILITNTEQLKASINNCYGHAVNSQRYLDKFVKFSFALPIASPRHPLKNGRSLINESTSDAHYRKLLEKSTILKNTALDNKEKSVFVSEIIKAKSLSLREVETLIRHTEIYQILTEQEGLNPKLQLGQILSRLMGIVFFCFNKKITRDFLNGTRDASELVKYFNESELVPYLSGLLNNSPFKFIVTSIGRECNSNSQLFASEFDDANWKSLVGQYFEGGAHAHGQVVTNILSPLTTLSFYAPTYSR